MGLLFSYSKTIASLVNYTYKTFTKLTPGENEKCGEICPGVGEYTQMSICTPCKVANSTKMANLAEICHGFGEYMTIDEKKGDERFCQFAISAKIATFQGPLFAVSFYVLSNLSRNVANFHMFVVLLLLGISEM